MGRFKGDETQPFYFLTSLLNNYSREEFSPFGANSFF